jgi:alkylated DNA repair protein alkB family protein 1
MSSGLQIAPGIVPPETQVLYISRILHEYMANPKHKINLQTDFDIEYPTPETEEETPTLFSYDPQSIHSTPKNPDSQKTLNMAQMLSRKLRWLTLGEQYHWPTRSYPKNGPTTFPSDLSTLVSGLFPHIRPESGVCLLYGQKDYMPVHRDVSELCERGLASFSFGCDGIFVIARGEAELQEGEDPKKRTVAIRVRSGDCVHMDGEIRWAWHAMPRTIPNSCPQWLAEWPAVKGDAAKRVSEKERKAYQRWKGFMGTKRLNVSVRQVWD